MTIWSIYLDGFKINSVEYDASWTMERVKNHLVDFETYPDSIVIKRG